jgi:hypothetical protein
MHWQERYFLCEMRDRSLENQRYRAGGLTLGRDHPNTVNFEPCDQRPESAWSVVDDNLLEHVAHLGWKHINLTGDYVWRQNLACGKRGLDYGSKSGSAAAIRRSRSASSLPS